MKFSIYNEPKKEEEVYLKLVKEDGNIVVYAVDKLGNKLEKGRIVGITANGLLKRYYNCKVPGIIIDKLAGRIQIERSE